MVSRDSLLKTFWEQNRKILLVLLVLVLICCGVYLAERSYLEPELERLRLEQSSLQQELRQQQQRVRKDGMPLSSAEQIAKDLERFHEIIPDKIDFPEFVGDLFAWADQAELAIKQIAYQPEVEPELGFLKYGLSFSVQGDYNQLKKFIHLLENSSRILIVDSIALAGKAERESLDSSVALNIRLTTYFQEQGQ